MLATLRFTTRTATPSTSAKWSAERYSNGGTNPGSIPLTGSIAGFGTYVVANNASEFTNEYGFAPDAESGNASGNGDDVYTLLHNGQIVDVYGVIGVDGSGETWEYTDSVAQRDPLAIANPTFDQGEWTITSGTLDSTPGVHGQGQPPGPGYANSITVDGSLGDWFQDEQYGTTSNVGLGGLTWDEENLYLSFKHPDLETGGNLHWLVVYLQTQSAGATSGVRIGSQQPSFDSGLSAFEPNLFFATKLDNSYYMANSFDSSTQKWTGNGDWFYNSAAQFKWGNQSIEIEIPLNVLTPSTLLSLDEVSWAMSLVYEGQGFESTYAGVPANMFIDGYDPVWQGHYYNDLLGSSPKAVMLP